MVGLELTHPFDIDYVLDYDCGPDENVRDLSRRDWNTPSPILEHVEWIGLYIRSQLCFLKYH